MLRMFKDSRMYAPAKEPFMQIKVIVVPAKQAAARKGCHLAAIKKNNMKGKNVDQDHW